MSCLPRWLTSSRKLQHKEKNRSTDSDIDQNKDHGIMELSQDFLLFTVNLYIIIIYI